MSCTQKFMSASNIPQLYLNKIICTSGLGRKLSQPTGGMRTFVTFKAVYCLPSFTPGFYDQSEILNHQHRLFFTSFVQAGIPLSPHHISVTVVHQ